MHHPCVRSDAEGAAPRRARPAGWNHFPPYGVWSSDGTTRFYAPQDPNHVSHSIVEGAEYAVLENMLATGLRPRIVCVELEHPSPVRNVRTVLALRRAGYDVCRVDGRNITLVLRQL